MAKLALNDGVRTQVFRKIVRLLQTDPILQRTIRPTSWYTWDGRSDMKQEAFFEGGLPAIRLTPAALPAQPSTNVRFQVQFLIRVELAVGGLNMDDIMNLWDAVHYALFPGSGSVKTLAAIQSVPGNTPPVPNMGTNVISFGLGTPAFTPIMAAVGSEMLVAEGDIWIDMMVPR